MVGMMYFKSKQAQGHSLKMEQRTRGYVFWIKEMAWKHDER